MINKNRKYDTNKYLMNINRLSEKYIMLSACLSNKNIHNILFRSIDNNALLNRCTSSLDDWLKHIHDYKIDNAEKYRQLLTDYNTKFFNYPTIYIDNFINFVSADLIKNIIELSYIASGKDRKSVPLNNANVPNKNLIFTFRSNVFLAHLPNESEIPYYANAFWNFILLILLTNYINSFTNNVVTLNMSAFHNFINLNILSGVRLSVEFNTEVMYEEFFEEISQFIPSNKHDMVKKVNEDKQSVFFRVKNNLILAETFKKDGWFKGVKKEFDPVLDRKSIGELRIKKGSMPNSIEIILYITGMRTISRILSRNCNPLGKIYLHNFWQKGGVYVAHIISFYFRTIVGNCNLKIGKSHYSTYNKFIENYDGERNIALKSAVIILLSELPVGKRNSIVNKCFKKDDYREKREIYDKVAVLDEQLKSDKNSATAKFYNTLRRYYGW